LKQLIRTILDDKGSHVESIGPEATVADGVRRMNEHRIGSLLVMEGVRPVGIFTERDVLVRVVAERLDPDATPIRQVMTSPLVAIGPDQTVEDAMVIITKRRCRHLPVMDGSDLLGMVSIGDITRSLISHQKAEIQDLVSYITWG
jgi:CBS domain-containing protein